MASQPAVESERPLLDTLQAIRTRRAIKQYRDEPLPREWIEELLDAAHWAPNHHLSHPWRFHVFTGEGRAQLDAPLASFGNLSRSLQGFLASLDAGELQDGSEGEPHAA